MDDKQVAIEGFQSLLDKAKALAIEAGALKRVAVSLSKLEGYQNLRRLEHDLTTLESLALLPEEALGMARTAVAAARLWLRDEWRRRASVFSEELSQYLQDRAIPTQAAGNEIRMDPFVLTLEPARDSAILSYSGEPVGKPLAMSCPVVFKAYSDSLSLLERNQTPPESFSDELLEAYTETCRWKGIRQGGRARLSDIHFTIFTRRQSSTVRCDPRKGRIKEYPRYQFAWDIGLLLKNPDWMIRSGSTITLNPSPASSARSRTDSVRVFSPNECDQVLGTMQA